MLRFLVRPAPLEVTGGAGITIRAREQDLGPSGPKRLSIPQELGQRIPRKAGLGYQPSPSPARRPALAGTGPRLVKMRLDRGPGLLGALRLNSGESPEEV